MIFDTHAHYDARQFDADRDEVLSSLPARGVGLVVDPGCDEPSSRAAVALAGRYPFLYAAVGWHPEEWESWTGESMAILRELVRAEKVVAVGEIGLDYYWDADHKPLQKEMLERQINLALREDLPVIIHDREAHGDALEMISRYEGLRGVFHCFSGSAEMASELLRRGWYLGVRGKRNDSGNLPWVIETIAALKGVTPEEVERASWENGCRLFRIDPGTYEER